MTQNLNKTSDNCRQISISRRLNGNFSDIGHNRFPTQRLTGFHPKRPMLRAEMSSALGSLPSFAAQSTNGRNAENRPFAALVANVSVADETVLEFGCVPRQALQSLGGDLACWKYGVGKLHRMYRP